jgi:hypothetical protein
MNPGEETTTRIRWYDDSGGNLLGCTGTVGLSVFKILAPVGEEEWVLISELRGQEDARHFGDDPEALKEAAEEWLAGFVASLGAVFPEPPAADPDCEECGFGLPRHDKDCSHYRETTVKAGEE